jgi:hypothetical protein
VIKEHIWGSSSRTITSRLSDIAYLPSESFRKNQSPDERRSGEVTGTK